MQESFWWWQCSDRYIISLYPHLHTLFPPSLISLMVFVDVKHHVYLLTYLRMYLWWSLFPCIYTHARCLSKVFVAASVCDVFQALINSLVCCFAQVLWASFCFRLLRFVLPTAGCAEQSNTWRQQHWGYSGDHLPPPGCRSPLSQLGTFPRKSRWSLKRKEPPKAEGYNMMEYHSFKSWWNTTHKTMTEYHPINHDGIPCIKLWLNTTHKIVMEYHS